jgi:hypothetical protein
MITLSEYNADLSLKLLWVKTNEIKTWAEAWRKCHRADWMLWLHEIGIIKIADQHLRKFACRCIIDTPIGDGRTIYNLVTDERLRDGVETALHFANGWETQEELTKAYNASFDVLLELKKANKKVDNIVFAAMATTCENALAAAKDALFFSKTESMIDYPEWETNAFHATLLRDIVGNPFPPEVAS